MPLLAYIDKRFGADAIARIRVANEILREYEAMGYDLTLRQLFYQHVARGLIPNSDREYKKLGSLVNDARLAGRIDWNHIVDRTRFLRPVSSWTDPSAIMRGAARSYQIDLWEPQDERVEVWIEKDALVGVVERACETLRVPYLSCRGYTSQSEMWGASQRFMAQIRAGKHVTVLHLGDHDPSGIDMSRDIQDRIVTFIANDHYRDNDYAMEPSEAVDWAEEQFTLNRIALNWDQIQQYGPPPNPAKLTDSRSSGYIREYGAESWELDALEPNVINDLIRANVEGLIDHDLWRESKAREDRERTLLEGAAQRWSDVAAFLDGGSDG